MKKKPHRQHGHRDLPPLHRDPWELRASIKERVAMLRRTTAITIALWIELSLVALYDLHKLYKFDTFYDYVAADYGKKNHEYIDRCLAIATLNPADFEGCFIPVEALIVTARALGPQTRAVLIAATRAAVLEGADVLKACRLVRELPDLEAAVLLHRWLVQGEKMPQEAEEEASAKGSEEKEEKEEKEQTLEALGQELLEQCWYFAGLMWDLQERQEVGQRMSPELARKLYARLRAMPQIILDTAELVLLPDGRVASGMASVVEEGERRQARRAEGAAATTPPSEGAATPPSEGEGDEVVRQAHHERSGGADHSVRPEAHHERSGGADHSVRPELSTGAAGPCP